MTMIDADVPLRVKREPHEMLNAYQDHTGHWHIRINFSSLDILQTCKRRGYFALERKLVSTSENAATLFGSAIHAAMEVWYVSPKADRKPGTAKCDDSHELMAAGQEPLAHGQCSRCAAIFAFLRVAEPLKSLPDNDKRSVANGITILNNYFDHYLKDPFSIMTDELGPLCERKIEFEIFHNAQKTVTFFGTIDSIFYNPETNSVVVVDHKTTSALGTDFYNRIRPNFQYTGYVMAAQRVLGLQTDTFMSNGIQVAKTVRSLARQVTKITPEDFAELKLAVDWVTDDYIRCKTTGVWPQSTPNACTQWGGCTYRPICEVPKGLQENVIQAQYANKEEQT